MSLIFMYTPILEKKTSVHAGAFPWGLKCKIIITMAKTEIVSNKENSNRVQYFFIPKASSTSLPLCSTYQYFHWLYLHFHNSGTAA